MDAFLSHPDMMSQVPTIDKATFEGRTLFINGDRSKFVAREDEAMIRKVFPNAEFAWLKDCGHLLHIDKQKEFCEKVIVFLEK
jgi:pimeloyl-ACP methyl ester carboxylesterase